ncbi:MAG TPA: hypothetical protein VF551_01530, partial [Chthoniobacterales bacterium]
EGGAAGGLNEGGRTGLPDGVGMGGRAMGGALTGEDGADGASGVERFGGSGGAPFPGAFGGRLMRTVSRPSAASPGLAGARGGNVIRTVSFFGSFRSLIGDASLAPEIC